MLTCRNLRGTGHSDFTLPDAGIQIFGFAQCGFGQVKHYVSTTNLR